jgi:hypothetical protein
MRSLDDCVFTGRVLLYVDGRLAPTQIQEIVLLGQQQNLAVDVRDATYAERMDKRQTPDAFIAHDSQDKANIARPLAVSLSQGPCKVWFDEFSLEVGDRLRDKIESGLKTCKKCILVLTPNFLNNTGWTKTEFDSIFTRELLTREDIVLPVWAGVSQHDVFNYSPALANRLGVDWALGIDEVTRRLLKAIL